MGWLRSLSAIPFAGAALFVAYGLLALFALWLGNLRGAPTVLTNASAVFAFPLMLLATPLTPLLRRLGLIVTAYWSSPTVTGYLVVILVWGVVFACAGGLLRNLRSAR